MNFMKRYFLLILNLLFTLFINAQVTGKVIDAKTRKPIDYVNVYYEGKNCGEMTDEDGRFVIKEDSTWNELTIHTLGYVTQVIKLNHKSVNSRAHKSRLLRIFNNLLMLALFTSDDRGKNGETSALAPAQNRVYNLIFALLLNLAATVWTMSMTDACKKKTVIIVNFCDGAHS